MSDPTCYGCKYLADTFGNNNVGGWMKMDEIRIRHNCLNCKHCTLELTCDKDNENIPFPLTQELSCCELNEMNTDN